MRKPVFCFLLAMLFIANVFLISACQKKIGSTNLSHVYINGFQLGYPYKDIDTSAYTVSNRFTADANIETFEEIRIGVLNGQITFIEANVPDVAISLNETQDPKIVEDVIKVLEENYRDEWYDREQSLRALLYEDKEHHIRARFIFNNYTYALVWIQLETMAD